ncbi:FAD-dependent monooxygenase [Actimicrobium sp. CCI2.3]|uniref:FAD-dependent monooxygenase n=1 Tax=Actimicrobium sp. CCI2.3 TaxID=3048616 RepID=UPI002AB57CF4|nr:FAD-dependent monooxygenase [Actimicrobium sp. CCI2.3]MDY7573762.1 FAD-dependent monooxygenase [Actimicrobium sp. CCI2.3]MEB0022373.1 FAD-dependent monooxygenase [Actimicrobium sp. CCI2.3]
MQTDVDIAICGAGPVGLVLAGLLVQRGVAPARIALIDAKTAAQSAADPRSIALSYGSRQILEQVGAWPVPAQAISQIHVSRRGHFGRTLMDRADYDLPALGYVTRYGALVTALSAAATQAGIVVRRPMQVSATDELTDHVTLSFDDGSSLRSDVLIQAEGGVFAQQPARTLHRDYRQSAIVTHVTTSVPLMQRAFERFTSEGPLALLPQDDGYAVVWCAHSDTAERLMTLTDSAFLIELAALFGGRVGRFLDCKQRFMYPLGLNAHVAPTARTVAIGNAAQTLHPVAGQGLNLGLRDAMVLARLLASDVSPAALTAFHAQRSQDRGMTIRVTDAMARVFASAPEGTLSQGLLGLSLGLMDAVAPARKMLAQQMMYGQR